MTGLTREETAIAEDLIFRQLASNYMARASAYRSMIMRKDDQDEVIEKQEDATCAAN